MSYTYCFASDQHQRDDDTVEFAASAALAVSQEQKGMNLGMSTQTPLAVLGRMNLKQRAYTLGFRFVERHKGMLSMTSQCVDV